MKKYLAVIFVLYVANPCGAIDVPNNYESIVVSLKVESQIRRRTGGGTGFFYNSGKWVYLITAKHVVEKFMPSMDDPVDDGKLEATFYTIEETEKMTRYQVDIATAVTYFHDTQDIVAVRIGKYRGDSVLWSNGVKRLENFGKTIMTAPLSECARFEDIPVAADVLIAGFPSFSQSRIIKPAVNFIDITKPLYRSGIVSGKNNKLKLILLDAQVFYGNSGGPVLMSDQGKRRQKMIGIVIASQNRIYDLYDSNENLAQFGVDNGTYAIVVPIDSITDLIADREKLEIDL